MASWIDEEIAGSKFIVNRLTKKKRFLQAMEGRFRRSVRTEYQQKLYINFYGIRMKAYSSGNSP